MCDRRFLDGQKKRFYGLIYASKQKQTAIEKCTLQIIFRLCLNMYRRISQITACAPTLPFTITAMVIHMRISC